MNIKPFIEIDEKYFNLAPFDMIEPTGYEEPDINAENGLSFPYCCDFHKGIYKFCESN